MFRPLRTVISLAVLVGALWFAFAVPLGGHTFAEHVDTISETPEARQLLEGTRATINPALQEARDRILGEYVEAPTWIPDAELTQDQPAPTSELASRSEPRSNPASEPRLPGRH